jgi:hypothetical protein
LVKPTRFPLTLGLPVPAGEYFAGLRELALHNAHGQRAYFLGQTSLRGGWKAYYPVAILVKWPLIIIAVSLAGFVITFSARRRRTDFWILLSFPLLYFALAIFAHFNIGERHVLPLLPFALLFAGAVGEKLTRSRTGVAIAMMLVALNAADVLRYAPDYLSYFDAFISPKRSYRLLADSNLDWGQGLLALHKYELEHPSEQTWLAYFGSVDPQVYGIRARQLAENEQVSGTVIVSATELAGEYLTDPTGYRWLLQYGPMSVLDHSLFVFHVDHSSAEPLSRP